MAPFVKSRHIDW